MRSARSRLRSPGGARRSRTDDILLAKQALYQLSYGPVPMNGAAREAKVWGHSSAGRAPDLHSGGRRFDPVWLHHPASPFGLRRTGPRLASFHSRECAMRGFGLPLSNEGMRPLNKIEGFKRTRGTETSQYPEERTSTETPLVVASERGLGQWQT